MNHRPSIGMLWCFLLVIGVGPQRVRSQTPATSEAALGAEVDSSRFPEVGAVILKWEQQWILHQDGTIDRRDHKLIKLLDRRAVGQVADPRIDYVAGQDRLTIHKAQTIQPDGQIIPVPDYAFNLASPNDVAGWPEYAGWRQQVVSFSAVAPGAIIELDYEITTKPKSAPWFEADLKLQAAFPIIERTIVVAAPKSAQLKHQLDNLSPTTAPEQQIDDDDLVRLTWRFKNLPADAAQPMSRPWYERGPRLRFTTCPSGKVWTSEMMVSIENAAQPRGGVGAFAAEVIADEPDPAEQVRLLSRKLRDTFNFIASPKTMRSAECRNVATVFQSNYGNPLESAALLLAMVRAAGMQAALEIAVTAHQWDPQVPTGAGFAGAVVVVDLPEEPMYIHPQHGEFRNPGNWGRHLLLSLNDAEDLRITPVLSRGFAEQSRLTVGGQLTINSDGSAGGDFRIRLTGGFYDPLQLKTSEQQKKLIERIMGHTLAGLKLTSHSITALSDETLKATASVSTDALDEVGDQYVLRLGEGPLFLKNGFDLPAARQNRTLAVQTAGAFVEEIDLIIELPDDWPAPFQETAVIRKAGNWGAVLQQRIGTGRTIRFRRIIDVKADTLAPADFAELRSIIDTLRTTEHTHLVISPKL